MIEEPTPDGRLVITRRDHEQRSNDLMEHHRHMPGHYTEVVEFKDTKGHHPCDIGLQIMYADHRRLIPWNDIVEIDVIYNSDDYQKQLEAWRQEQHKQHLDSEADQNCPLCYAENPLMGARVIVMPGTDNAGEY